MQTTFALAALAAIAFATPTPQGITQNISPPSAPPAGFSTSYPGSFEITAVNFTSPAKRDLSKRTCGTEGSLTLTLSNSVLKDAEGRTGYIAANYQFQFDGPAQTGAIYTAGFSVGTNNSLALGGSAVFYQCLSGTFYNLYDRSWAPQCSPVLIVILPCGTSTTPAITQSSDGQPEATTAVSQISDGQPQAASAIPISELSDGQPQMPTAKPCAITQISDGQPQVTSCVASVTQISKAPTATAAPVSQAPTSTAAPITQSRNGTATSTPKASTPAPFTGFAPALSIKTQLLAGVFGLAAVALL